MNKWEIKVKVIKSASRFISNIENRDRFVKIKHKPSGITVTKYNRSQPKAYKLALEEITELVDLWENGI